jgi:hypothetical protein
MTYILVNNLTKTNARVIKGTDEKPLTFNSYQKAAAHVERNAMEETSVLALCSANKNYLV